MAIDPENSIEKVRVVASPKSSVISRLWGIIASSLAAASGRRNGRFGWAAILGAIVAITAGSSLIGGMLASTTPARQAENLLYDLRLAITAKPTHLPIVIVKIDDEALNVMRTASPCHCLSPIDKIWLGKLVKNLSDKGARVIGIDYILDTWRDAVEFDAFEREIDKIETPIIAVAPPGSHPGTDFPASRKITYADARTLIKDDYDDVVRRYDPLPGSSPSFASAVVNALGKASYRQPFRILYSGAFPGSEGDNVGAIAPSVSASLVEVLPEVFFKDKIILIGRVTRSASADATSLREDTHTTPLHYMAGHFEGTPGVEVHGHAIVQMLSEARLSLPPISIQIAILLVASLLGVLFGRSSQGLWVTIGLLIIAAAASIAASLLVLSIAGIMVPMVAPLISGGLAYLTVGRITATELRADRALFAGTLERYLAPQVIERIVEGNEPVTIGANTRTITVIATDIADFSVLVGTTPADQFSDIINAYFDGVIDVLWQHEAMLDKLTGDGLIALFGAPIDQDDHAKRAIACAREIDQFSRNYAETVKSEQNIHFGKTRIGLHSGPALVGNFGGKRRFNYTAYGETVVIAARLEAANKVFGTHIMASSETIAMAAPVDGARSVGAVELKGVATVVEAYVLD